jgi:hypothetical protein
VHDPREVVERLTTQEVAYELGPGGVVLDGHKRAGAALAQQPREEHGARAAAALHDACAPAAHDLVAHHDEPRRAHRPGAPGQVAAHVEQRAQHVPGVKVLGVPWLVGQAGQATTGPHSFR